MTFGILVESGTFIHDDIDVSEDDTSDSEHILVESRMLVQIARYSLATLMIEDRIKHETDVDSIVVTLRVSSFSKSLKFIAIVHQVTCISSFVNIWSSFLSFFRFL